MFRKYMIGLLFLSLTASAAAMQREEVAEIPAVDAPPSLYDLIHRNAQTGKTIQETARSLLSADGYQINVEKNVIDLLDSYAFFQWIYRSQEREKDPSNSQHLQVIINLQWTINQSAALAFEGLLKHFRINELWLTDKSRTELLLIDLARWVQDNEAVIKTTLAELGADNYISALAQVFEKYRNNGGILLASDCPEARIDSKIAAFVGIGGRFGQLTPSLKYGEAENYDKSTLIAFKKLFHFLYNMSKKYQIDFDFINADNIDNNAGKNEASETDDTYSGTHLGGYISILLKFFIQQQLPHDNLFWVLELAHQWNLRSIQHAIINIFSLRLSRETTEEKLAELAATIPLHFYPDLLKNRANAQFLSKLLNSFVSSKAKQAAEQNVAIDSQSIITADEKGLITDSLDSMVDCIECLNLEGLKLHPWLEERLQDRFNEKVPLSKKKIVCDHSTEFIAGKRILRAFNADYDNIIAFCENHKGYIFQKDGKPFSQTQAISSFFLPLGYSTPFGKHGGMITVLDFAIIFMPDCKKDSVVIPAFKAIPESVICFDRGNQPSLCAGCKDGSILIFNGPSGERLKVLKEADPVRRCIRMASYTDTLFALFDDGTFCAWNKHDFKLIGAGKVPSPDVKMMHCINQDRVAFGCKDGSVFVYDLSSTEKPLAVAHLEAEITALNDVCMGHLLIGTVSGQVSLLNIATGKLLPVSKGLCHPVMFIVHNYISRVNIEILYANGILEKCFVPEIQKGLDFYRLGKYYYTKKTKETDERAFRCFTRAHQSTSVAAQVRLAEMCFHGRGTQPNLQKVLEQLSIIQIPRNRVSARASMLLAEIALRRDGNRAVMLTDQEAWIWLCRQAADRYLDGGERDKAFTLYDILASQNDNKWVQAWSWYHLAQMHCIQDLRHFNYAKARECYEKAAQQTFCRKAQLGSLRSLITMYESGIGIARDLDQVNFYKLKEIEATEQVKKHNQEEPDVVWSRLGEIYTADLTSNAAEIDPHHLLEDPVKYLKWVAKLSVNKQVQARACLYLIKMEMFGIKDVQLSAEELSSYHKICIECGDAAVKNQMEEIDKLRGLLLKKNNNNAQ